MGRAHVAWVLTASLLAGGGVLGESGGLPQGSHPLNRVTAGLASLGGQNPRVRASLSFRQVVSTC